MEKALRRKFTDEFKEGAVQLVRDHGYKAAEAASNLGIHPTQLWRWLKATSGQPDQKIWLHRVRICQHAIICYSKI